MCACHAERGFTMEISSLTTPPHPNRWGVINAIYIIIVYSIYIYTLYIHYIYIIYIYIYTLYIYIYT